MPRKRITVLFVDKVRPPSDKAQEDYFDTALPSFGLRVGQKRKTYFVMTRVLRNGVWKMTRVKLGTSVELSVDQARDQAKLAIELAAKGEPPSLVKAERKAVLAAESCNTFAAVRDEFLEKYRGRQNRRPAPRTLDEIRRVLNSELFSAWLDLPLTKITRRDVMDVLDVLIKREAEVMANRTLAYLSMLFNWALQREIINTNPTEKIKKPGAERSRERTLALHELRAIWQATEPTQSNKGDLFACIVKILLLTGQRREEVGGMRWSELNFDTATWVLPTTRTKNKREHLVPLSPPVVALLKTRYDEQAAMGLNTDFVFTSAQTAGSDKKPSSFSGWSKSKERLDRRSGIEKWTLHDLRRTLATRMAEDLSIAPHIIEAILNHVSGVRSGVAGTYNRALYLQERRDALNAWADYIQRVVDSEEVANLEPLNH